MTSPSPVSPLVQIQLWVDEVVVGLNFCPFAKAELAAGRVRLCEMEHLGLEQALESFADEAIALVNRDVRATTLLVLSTGFNAFDDYLELLDLCEALLEECGWDQALQLASFHPDYCFEGVEQDDASNFTNRSPLPIIHLLRRDDLAQAISHYPEVDSIPENNQHLARERGAAFFEAVLDRCRKNAN